MSVDDLSARVGINLPTVLDHRAVEPLRDSLLASLDRADVVLEASGVQRVGTIGLQLLIAAAGSAQRHGRRMVIENASPALREAIDCVGLTSRFADWIRA